MFKKYVENFKLSILKSQSQSWLEKTLKNMNILACEGPEDLLYYELIHIKKCN